MKLGKIVVAFCLAASLLVGCGGKPKDISQDMYDLGLKALEVTEDYLAADLDIDAAYEKMSDILTRVVVDEEYAGDESIKIIFDAIDGKLELIKKYPKDYQKTKMEELKEVKDKLVKKLGI